MISRIMKNLQGKLKSNFKKIIYMKSPAHGGIFYWLIRSMKGYLRIINLVRFLLRRFCLEKQMVMKRQNILIAIILLFLASACSNPGGTMKSVTGKIGEVVVLIPKETWKGNVGDSIRKVLAQPQLSLPQEEPIFKLIDVPPIAFTDIFKSSRNILSVKISPTLAESGVEFTKDSWASPQYIVNIKAKSEDEFYRLFRSNSDKIIGYFMQAERDRLKSNYAKYYDKAIYNTLLKSFNLDLRVPPGFNINKKDSSFLWTSYETPEISQGLIIFTYKYTSDSTFTKNYLLNKVDSILNKRIPGPTKGSYMALERQVDPVFNVFKYQQNYTADMRGLWRVQNDFMGGPYINFTTLDAKYNRIVSILGYVYAPRFDKLNYLRQVEAMIYTLQFPHQKENDKINMQIEMGN